MPASQMYAEEAGLVTGVPMLMVHGFLSSNAQWDMNVDELGQTHRLIMVKLMGHGRSATPDDAAAYSTEFLLAEFERIRTAHGFDSWWVCGQSLGGAIAILYCLAYPERVRGLVFTNSRAAFGIKRRQSSNGRDERAGAISSTRDLAVHPINATRLPEAIKTRLVAAADNLPIHVVDHFLSRRHTWTSTDRMAKLDMPVLLVNGRWESAFQPFVTQARELIDQLEVVDLEGGHAINVEQCEGFNAAVLDFTARHADR